MAVDFSGGKPKPDHPELGSDPILKVHYTDDVLVVVEKPSGFLSVPGRGPDKQDSVSARVHAAYPGCFVQPAVHRLDMDTSGLLVLARTTDAHRRLSVQFQKRETKKTYTALLDGILEGESGTVELPFRLDVDNRPYQIYDPVHGKMGITHWEKLAVEGNRTRVRFVPVTGRTHQLRVHAAHPKGLGIPIVGDPLYDNGAGSGGGGAERLMLHAEILEFTHPVTGRPMRFTAPTPF